MPSERFFNLPTEKRQRILHSAINELTHYSVEELSINRIIKDADISRGSFYQYFEDKNDLLIYITSDIRREIEKRFAELMMESQGNPIQAACMLLHFAVDMSIAHGGGEMCRNIFSNIRVGSPDPFEMVRQDLAENTLKTLRQVYDLSNYDCSDDDMLDIFDMVIDLMRTSMARIFSDLSRRDQIEKSFSNKLRIIEKSVIKGETNV